MLRMQRQQLSRVAGFYLALLIAIFVMVVHGLAESGDTPIVIMDGSLSMDSAVPWSEFRGTGDQRTHPHTTKAVTKVTVTVNGKDQVITFNGQQCAVDITYAGSDIKFSTGNNGRGLRITPFGVFQNGETPNRLRHRIQNAKISHVTVTKAGAKAVDVDVAGGTKITINYQ